MPGDTEITIATMRDAAAAMRSVTTSAAEELRALAVARNAIDAAISERLAAMDAAKEHEAEGASSITTWARRELNQDATETRHMVRAAATFRDLPEVGDAARGGALSFGHVNSFTYALKHVGVDDTRLLEEPLLEFAKHVTVREFHAKVRQVRDVVHPDDLDQAWLDGMDRRDIRLARTTGGWHVTGFLDIETGAKLNTIQRNLSVPRDADDTRTPSERRMEALDQLCTAVLEHGLPVDNGIRPHINVTVDADTLKAMAEQQARTTLHLDLKPAHLEGFGPIGPQFLAHLLCGAEITPFLIRTVGKNIDVLDVGLRHHRSGEARRPGRGEAAHQRDEGARPGQHNHHVIWWKDGGSTDTDVMVGLCRKCHTLIHTHQLLITGTYLTGFEFTNARGSPLRRAA